MWLGQLEWRFPIWWRFRGVAFGSIADVADKYADYSFETIKWGLGTGIRFMLDEDARISFRFDFAFGREGQRGFYLGVNEVF